MQEFLGKCKCFLLEFPVGCKPRGKSQLKCFLAVDARTQRHELDCLGESDNLMQVVDAARVTGERDT